MKVSEWIDIHADVTASMSTNHKDLSMTFDLVDKSHAGRTSNRTIPFRQLPLEQGEVVLEDYIASIFELLYHDILDQREKRRK